MICGLQEEEPEFIAEDEVDLSDVSDIEVSLGWNSYSPLLSSNFGETASLLGHDSVTSGQSRGHRIFSWGAWFYVNWYFEMIRNNHPEHTVMCCGK